MQLIACLQSGQFPHYFQQNVDLYKGVDRQSLTLTARATWSIVRLMTINEFCYDQL